MVIKMFIISHVLKKMQEGGPESVKITKGVTNPNSLRNTALENTAFR